MHEHFFRMTYRMRSRTRSAWNSTLSLIFNGSEPKKLQKAIKFWHLSVNSSLEDFTTYFCKAQKKKALDYVKTNVAPSFSWVFLLFTHLFAKLTSHTSLAMFSSWLLWALSQGPPGFQPRGGGIICIGGKPPDAIFFGVFCTDCYFGLNLAYHRKAPKSAKILVVACHGWYRQRSPWRHDFSFVVATEVEEEDWKATVEEVADHVVRTEKKNPLAIEKGKYTRGLLLCSCRRKEKHSEVENRENRVHFFRGK